MEAEIEVGKCYMTEEGETVEAFFRRRDLVLVGLVGRYPTWWVSLDGTLPAKQLKGE